MIKRIIYSLTLFFLSFNAVAQTEKTEVDSLAYYDDLFNELESFLDSITAPRTMLIVNVGAMNRFLNYQSKESSMLTASRKLTLTPSLGYYNKNGLGVGASGTIVDDGSNYNLFQYLLSGSYDYMKHFDFITGIGYTRYITKDSLPFYTSPLKNEVSAYFLYKNSWFRPAISASYGWGSRSDVEEREEYITSLRLRPYGYTRIDSRESVSDFSVLASVRHDFYWLNVVGDRSVFKLTPQMVFTSGTQKFGFNQSSNTYGVSRIGGTNVLTNSENIYLDDQVRFQPLSLAAFLKAELSLGKFFVQPQAMVDYYFPASEKNLTTIFSVNAGFIFSD